MDNIENKDVEAQEPIKEEEATSEMPPIQEVHLSKDAAPGAAYGWKARIQKVMTKPHVLKGAGIIVGVLFVAAMLLEVYLGIYGSNNLIQISENNQRITELEEACATLRSQLGANQVLKKAPKDLPTERRERLDRPSAVKASRQEVQIIKPFFVEARAVTKARVSEDFQIVLQNALDVMAKSQNDYSNINLSIDEIKMVAAAMDVYLADDSAEGRVPWFTRDGSYHWMAAPPIMEEREDYPVIWLSRDEIGKVNAVCTATWESSSEKFSNMKWYHVGSAEAPVETYSDADFEKEVIMNA